LDPPTERLRRAEACTGRGAACRAPMAPRPAACLAGRPIVRLWHDGRCPGPRAPGRRRRQPRSLRSAPLRGRLRRGFDPADDQGQRLEVAAARCAHGAFSHWCRESTGRRNPAPAISGNGYASPGRRGLGGRPRQAPAGRFRDSHCRAGGRHRKQGGRAAPLGPPARMERAGGATGCGMEPHRGYRPPPLALLHRVQTVRRPHRRADAQTRPIGARDRGQRLRQPRQEGPRGKAAAGPGRAV
jgi:hypothetical protein